MCIHLCVFGLSLFLDLQKTKSVDVFNEVYRVQAGVFLSAERERVSSA